MDALSEVLQRSDIVSMHAPATPDATTCVVLTGRPKESAAPMVAMATSSSSRTWRGGRSAHAREVSPWSG